MKITSDPANFALPENSTISILIMRVSAFPSIRPSRYGRKKRKCWSQIALAGMGEKGVPGAPVHV